METKDTLTKEYDGLIYKSQAIEAIGEQPLVWKDDDCEIADFARWKHDYAAIMEIPLAFPTIIQCKDCEDWETFWDSRADGYHYCPIIDLFTTGDFFCKFGERNDEHGMVGEGELDG